MLPSPAPAARPRLLAVALLTTLAASLLAPGGAAAQARAHGKAFDDAWNSGQDFFNLGKYDQARAQFDKARKLDERAPGPWRYLGRIAKLQERWQDCVDATTTAVKLKPDSANAAEVRADLEECRAKLGRPALTLTLPDTQGALAVVGDVEGAVVEVDGVRKGATPLAPVPLTPGKHVVRVSKEGYLPSEHPIEVVVGVAVDVVFTLAPDPSYKAPTPVELDAPSPDVKIGWLAILAKPTPIDVVIDGKPARAGADGTYALAPGDHVVEISAEGHEPQTRRFRIARGQRHHIQVALRSSRARERQNTLGYTFLGVALAAGGTGGVFGLLYNSAYEDARDAYEIERQRPDGAALPASVPEAERTTRAEYDAMVRRADRYGLVADVAFATAAVALGVSVYYLVLGQPEDVPQASGIRTATSGTLTPVVFGPGQGAGVVYSGELPW